MFFFFLIVSLRDSSHNMIMISRQSSDRIFVLDVFEIRIVVKQMRTKRKNALRYRKRGRYEYEMRSRGVIIQRRCYISKTKQVKLGRNSRNSQR